MANKYSWWDDNTYETPKLTRERFEQIRRAMIDDGTGAVTDYEYLEFLKLASYPNLEREKF